MKELTLMNGIFEATTAKQEIVQLLQDKVRFHGVKNFSNEIRYGYANSHHMEQSRKTKQLVDEILSLINSAEQQNQNVEVVATIRIKVC